MDFIETCQRFIEIDSSPGRGCVEIAKYASEVCRAAGMEVQLFEGKQGGLPQANMIAHFPSHDAEEEILLQSHLDTTNPGAFGLWSDTGHNPYNTTIKHDKIYGLGAANVKLDFLCKLRALEKYKDRPLKVRPLLAGTFGGEKGTEGAIYMVRKKMTRAKRALVGAPTNLKVWNEAKGMASVEIKIPFSEEEKKFRHEHDRRENSSSQSRIFGGLTETSEGKSQNAIVSMLEFLSQLPDGIAVLDLDGGIDKKIVPSYASLEFDVVDAFSESMSQRASSILKTITGLEKTFASYPEESSPSINIGKIRTREEYVVLLGVCTVPPNIREETYNGWMEELRRSCQQVNASFCITEYFPPFATEKSGRLVSVAESVLRKMDLPAEPTRAPRSSEANTFSRFGIQCLLFGAGQIREQAQNESVLLESLEKASLFYEKFIEEYCA